MKKTCSTIIALLLVVSLFAQNRRLENYGFEIKLEAKNNQLLIQNHEQIDTFALNVDNSLKNQENADKVIRSLRFDNNHLAELYTQYLNDGEHNKANLIQALVERSLSLPEQRIIFVDAAQTSNDEEIAKDELLPINEAQEPNTPSPFDKWTWIALGLGLLGGFLVGKLLSKNNKVASNTSSENKTQENTELTQAKEEVANIKSTLNKRLEFDEKYFGNSFDDIIKPLENALEAKDVKTIVPLLIQAATQYSALTRFKLEKKQSFDVENMQILLGTSNYGKSDYPTIDKNTSPDDIPNKLKVLIELLRHAQATSVDNAIVSGYKVQNI